jgi:short subunit dehydrogenase-like uncharacterized protein
MITVFGATGYTGQRIARTLDRLGQPFRLAGRSPQKLRTLATSLRSSPELVVADVRTPESFRGLFDSTRVLINCAGPFIDLGEPVVAQAATRGVHYLDITNELAYVYRLRQYDALARKTGAAIVSACAFEVAISDCVIAQQARHLPKPLEAAHILYGFTNSNGVISYGTRLSGLRTFAKSWIAYRAGKWVGRMPGTEVRAWRANGRTGRALTFPSAEVVTVPAHCAVRDVQAWVAVSTRWVYIMSAVMPLINLLLNTPVGSLMALSFRHLAPPPPERSDENFRFIIQIELINANGARTITLRGLDPYGLTAEIAAYAAGVISQADYTRSGVLAPSLAFDPEAFVNWLTTTQRVTLSVEDR